MEQEHRHAEAARDAANWAKAVQRLRVTEVPTGVANINVSGRRAIGPIQGFGRLWQKTYRVPLKGASVKPAEVVTVWKERFSSFWPSGSRFHAPLAGMAPGSVVLLDQMLPGHLRLSSGVLVLYADEESFTVMAAEGMPFAGWNTFSAFEADGVTVAQVQLLMRASDPLFEVAMTLFAHRMEDRHWQQTLRNLAAHFGATGEVEHRTVCLDPRWQWGKVGNIWYNAAIRSALYLVADRTRAAGRAVRSAVRGRPRP
jgi:hypothetical protein